MAAMFQDKYVFSQLTAFLNRTQFNNYVRKYDGNRYVKQLTEMAVKYGGWTSRDKPIDEERRFCSCIHDVQN